MRVSPNLSTGRVDPVSKIQPNIQTNFPGLVHGYGEKQFIHIFHIPYYYYESKSYLIINA